MSRKISPILPGQVAVIVKSPTSNVHERALIIVKEGDQVLSIDNTLKTENGNDVSLKLGAHVEITVNEK